METKDVLVIVLVVTALGFSIYKKYMKKNKPDQSDKGKSDSFSSVSPSKGDDYEPYLKK